MARSLLVAFSSLIIASMLGAEEPPRFIVHTKDAILPATPLAEVSEAGRVEFTTPGKNVPPGQLIELRQESRPRPEGPRRDFVILTHGDLLPLDPRAPVLLHEGRLRVNPRSPLQFESGKELSLYLPYVRLWFQTLPDGIDDADVYLHRLRQESRSRDLVLLRDGDRIEGSLKSLDAEGCVLVDQAREVHVPLAKLAGIAFGSKRPIQPRWRTTISHAVLADGGRLHFSSLKCDGKRWSGTTWFGTEISLPLEHLVALDVWHGSADYLSDLTPSRYDATPYLGIHWPLFRDAAVTQSRLWLGHDVFDKGLGTHSPCRVTYALDGRYATFEAVVGIDANAHQGRARLAVLVDEKCIEIDAGQERRCRDMPKQLRIDVRQAQTLTLVVDVGSLGDVQGHVDWANARLIRAEEAPK